MYMESTSNINKSKKLYLTNLFMSFVACTCWRIPKYHWNSIFIHTSPKSLNRLKTLSKIPIFTFFKVNAKRHYKGWNSLNLSSFAIYFLKILTYFRHVIIHSARKLNPIFSWKRNFANRMDIFLQINPNLGGPFRGLFWGEDGGDRW